MGYIWHQTREAFPLIFDGKSGDCRPALGDAPGGCDLDVGRAGDRAADSGWRSASGASVGGAPSSFWPTRAWRCRRWWSGSPSCMLLLPAGAVRLAALGVHDQGGVRRPDDPGAPVHRRAHARRDPGPSARPDRAGADVRRRQAAAVGARAARGKDRRAGGRDRGVRGRDLGGRRGDHRRRQLRGPRSDAGQRAARAVQLLRQLSQR